MTQIIWTVSGVISFAMMLYFIFKKTGISDLPVQQIEYLREKSFFGRKRYRLKLKNGKIRNLIISQKKSDQEALKNLFFGIGVPFKTT